jgi:glycosyltransferase involved in cell wall biosynthesis
MFPHPHLPRVAILLSTFNGAPFLHAQLESLLEQSHEHWVLYWRDDGSSDRTRAVMEQFARRAGQGRCVEVARSGMHLGVTASFHALLVAVSADLEQADVVAFTDQDDVWLPHKLARGIAALSDVVPITPALYCARQMLVDAALRPIGLSTAPGRPGGFPAALIQNIATGCTVMLNREAARLVAASRPSPATLHDWWCYLVVTGAGGCVVQDSEPVVLYRQHGGNLVGAPSSWLRRGVAALRRGPGVFMSVVRQHVAALLEQPELLTEQAMREVAAMHRALQRRNRLSRLATLRMPGLVRQTWAETLVFRCWFLIG